MAPDAIKLHSWESKDMIDILIRNRERDMTNALLLQTHYVQQGLEKSRWIGLNSK